MPTNYTGPDRRRAGTILSHERSQADAEQIEALIDESIEGTFPASDPPAYGVVADRIARLERDHPAGWPELRLRQWEATRDTLQLWSQVVGKIRLALAPMQNHWWQVPLYVSARGLTTTAMPYPGGTVELTFDFLDHVLKMETSWGKTAAVELKPRTVAGFYRAVKSALLAIDIEVPIWPHPVELANPIPFDQDEIHASYDGEAVKRFWHLLVRSNQVFHQFRSTFLGKCSPVHFWWGGFDLAHTRFSGRRAPVHPGGIPHLADRVTRESYSHECISVGWWPGGGAVDDAAFYAYAYPEPSGCSDAQIEPAGAYYHQELREWILPYEIVRHATDPDATLLTFLESTYAAAASLGAWDRSSLERS